MYQFIMEGRASLGLLDCHKYMISFAWVAHSEKEKFNIFPEVITVDTVAGTNNEGRPLLMMGGKDSNGKMFIFLRAYLPHEKGWIFRWLFSIVLPKMYSNTVLQRIRLVISDGDAQEYNQLDNAIQKYFPDIVRIRCGWHIVDRSWLRHFLKHENFPEEVTQKNYDTVKKTVKSWIYSWMKQGCETLEEYRLSKYLLYKYLQSKPVVDNVSTFFCQHTSFFQTNPINMQHSPSNPQQMA